MKKVSSSLIISCSPEDCTSPETNRQLIQYGNVPAETNEHCPEAEQNLPQAFRTNMMKNYSQFFIELS